MVLCGGKVSGIVDARTATKEQLGLLMTTIPENPERFEYAEKTVNERAEENGNE